jgi:hypothetical protein
VGRGYRGGINVSSGQFFWRAGGALLPSPIGWREYLLLLLRLLLCGWAVFNLLLKCIVGELSIPTLLIIPTFFSKRLLHLYFHALCYRGEVATSLYNWFHLLLLSLRTPALLIILLLLLREELKAFVDAAELFKYLCRLVAIARCVVRWVDRVYDSKLRFVLLCHW